MVQYIDTSIAAAACRRDARDWAKIILRETAELQFGNYRELPNCLSTYRFTCVPSTQISTAELIRTC